MHVFPMSSAQKGLWFLSQLEPENTIYNVITAIGLEGPVDAALLEASLGDVIARHEVLRTTFAEVGGSPLQIIAPELPPELRVVDLRALPESQHLALTLAASDYLRAFDLTTGPLLRALLVQIADTSYGLFFTTHHIVFDNWSLDVLYTELSAHYRARLAGEPAPLPPLALQFADYAHWQNKRLQTNAVHKQFDYWRQQLQGAPDVLQLPIARERPERRGFRGGAVQIELPEALTRGLRALGRKADATLFMTVLAGFAALLRRYGCGEDLLIGTPTANRIRPELESLIGYFINTLVLRIDLSSDPTGLQLLQRVRQVTLDAMARADVPLEQLIEEVRPDRSLSHTPLFQVVLDLHTEPTESLRLPGVTPRTQIVEGVAIQQLGGNTVDLNLSLGQSGDHLAGSLEFNTDLLDPVQAERFVRHLIQLLDGLTAQPEQPISRLPLLTADERHKLLIDWNGARQKRPETTLHQAVALQARRRTDAIAISTKKAQVSYGALDARANQLAHYLRALGVGPGSRVGLCLERSVELLIGLLGILKAGGAYVPIDPDHPGSRVAFLLEDAGIEHLVARASTSFSLGSARLVAIDAITEELSRLPRSDPGVLLRPGDLAAVIYTSGSTGRPKGVMLCHDGIDNLMYTQRAAWGLCETDRVLQFTSPSFDSSLWEMSSALSNGGTLVLPDPELASAPAELGAFADELSVTCAALPPTVLFRLEQQLPALRLLLSAGEACTRELVERWSLGRTFVNSYGPTETTVCSTQGVCTSDTDGPPALGRPLTNLRVYVLDRKLQLVPVGVPGEIIVAGDGLALGYLHRPGLTAERFVPDPFACEPGARMYRTGDLARYSEDGALRFLGRLDHQVKLRGLRVELGEIEQHLRQHATVADCIVVGRAGSGDEHHVEQLVAYLIPQRGALPTPTSLRLHLREHLPEHMIPARFAILEAWPLTANGKIDRAALPDPDPLRPELQTDHTPPRTDTERRIVELWSETLGIEQIGTRDNFFALGGHSLLAAAVVAGIRSRLDIELSLRELFEQPTIEALAVLVDRRRVEPRIASHKPLVFVDRKRVLPLSLAQERLWFLDRLTPRDTSYNIPTAFRLNGPLSAKLIEQCIDQLAARIEVLRTSFALVEGEPVLAIHAAAPTPLKMVDLSALPDALRDETCERLLIVEADRPFMLDRGPLWRALLIRTGSNAHVLLLTLHHAIADERSVEMLLSQLAELYREIAAGIVPRQGAPALQYADFAAWQRAHLADGVLAQRLSYWTEQLRGVLPSLDLPTDRPRMKVRSTRGARVPWQLSAEVTEAIFATCRGEGATLFMFLVASLNTLLHRYTGQDDLIIGTPLANRDLTEIQEMVGFFVNTLPLRASLSGDPTFRELLWRIRASVLGLFAHQDTPLEQLVDALGPERDLSRNPLFDVLVVLDSDPVRNWGLACTQGRSIDVYNHRSKFDLTLWVRETEAGLAGEWEYNADLFNASTIERLQEHLRILIGGMLADPGQRLSQLPIVSAGEQQLLRDWNQTGAAIPHRCVHELFEAQVAQIPERVALITEEARISYAALDDRSERLAAKLQALGVGRGTYVGVCLERSPDLVVALLAVLKTGGAYVPLDPSYPTERLRFLLEDSRSGVVLANARTQRLLGDTGATVLVLDEQLWSRRSSRGIGKVCRPSPEDAAYLIYTSGSTGQPKGVVVSHRNAVNLLTWAREAYPPLALCGVLASTSVSFDLSVFELFVPLAAGTTIVLINDALALGSFPWADEITLVNTVPSVLSELLRAGAVPRSVLVINVAGEPLSRQLADRAYEESCALELINLYAPSETTTYSTYAAVPRPVPYTDGQSPSIGRPLSNTQVHLLDRHGQLVPVGAVGEIYLGGAGVTLGYLHRSALTAERFLPDPSGNGERVYATGDLGRYRPDGTMVFLGRRDQQIKLRGFRIELGEIESTLETHPAISQAVVQLYGLDKQRLIAYVVAGEAAGNDLRRYLAERLPGHMVPDTYVSIDAIPRTPSGKVDRRALPPPSQAGRADRALPLAPRSPLEEDLVRLWCELLHTEQVGVDDSFFDLGGHSLLAVRLQAQLQGILEIELSLVDIFDASTPALLAKRIEQRITEQLAAIDDDEVLRLEALEDRGWA